MYAYDTATQAINDLMKRGYVIYFNLDVEEGLIKGDRLVFNDTLSLSPEEFEIDEMYRFEGNSDPGDEMVIYAISSTKHDAKGILVNAFGPYANPRAAEIVKKLSSHVRYQLN